MENTVRVSKKISLPRRLTGGPVAARILQAAFLSNVGILVNFEDLQVPPAPMEVELRGEASSVTAILLAIKTLEVQET